MSGEPEDPPPPEMPPENPPEPPQAAAPEPAPEIIVPPPEEPEQIYELTPEDVHPQIVTAAPQESAPAEDAYTDYPETEFGPEPEFEPAPEPAWQPPPLRAEDRNDLFGEPEIPLPGEPGPTPQQQRDAQRVLDLDLGRIKRTKRFGLFGTIFTVLFIAFFLAPVTWVGVYLFIDAPGTMLMLQRAAEGQSIRHAPVPFTRMSPYIVRSVIAAEDQNFCTHHGFDVAAIEDAMESNADGGRMRGGSTISQQTAKNLFLWPSRSWIRKGFETYFTALTEFMWPKQRIIEQYLNSAEWGDGIFGIEAAAQARFGVHAMDLSPLQAARLAAVLPSPNRWRVDSPGPYVRRRAATIVDRAQVVRNDGMASCVLAIDPRPRAAPTR